MNDDLGRILKEAVVTYSRYYPRIYLDVLKIAAKMSVRIANVLAKIRTEYLQNASRKRSARPACSVLALE